MAHTKDYVPKSDAEFDGWLTNLVAYVNTTVTAGTWTHIPADKVTALNQRQIAWHTAYVKTLGPHTNVDTETKKEAHAAAEHFVRQFYQQYLKFDPVTNQDRLAMGLPIQDPTRTPIGEPKTRPLLTDLRALGGFEIEFRFQDEETPDSSANPYGMNGCLLNYTWGPEKVEDYALLKETRLMTRSPFVLSLPPEAEWKFLSCYARWQNETGHLGKPSEIQHIAIS
jgi:hypothetical protein